jgi:hypothetical protein
VIPKEKLPRKIQIGAGQKLLPEKELIEAWTKG